MNIFESASKIVFISITLAVIGLTYMEIVEAKDFLTLATMSFTFYFSNKGNESNNFLNK